jgi:hypothetical protein
MQNSNYFVTTAKAGRFVLTLFETHRNRRRSIFTWPCRIAWPTGMPCPQPLADQPRPRWRRWPANRRPCSPACRERPDRNAVASALPRSAKCLPAASGGGRHARGLAQSLRCAWRQRLAKRCCRVLSADEAACWPTNWPFRRPRIGRHCRAASFMPTSSATTCCGSCRRVLPATDRSARLLLRRRRCLLFDLAVVANDWCLMRNTGRTGRRLCRRAPAVNDAERSLAGHAAGGRPALLAASAGGQPPPAPGRSGDDQGSRRIFVGFAAFRLAPSLPR